MKKTNAFYALFLAAGLVLFGCLQPPAAPTATPSPTPTPAAPTVAAALPTPVPVVSDAEITDLEKALGEINALSTDYGAEVDVDFDVTMP